MPGLEDAAFCTRCGARLARRVQTDVCIGTLVGGRYRIVGILGEGGMGKVYAADQALGTEVRRIAVKVLRKDAATTPDALKRFRRECGTASKLVHPNAVAIHDFGTTDSGEPYIAMDLVAGRPLGELLAGGGISPARASALLAQICEVVDEAHALGIVHRDLKPDNILVTVDRRGREIIKILDFGIALPGARADGRICTRLTLAGTIMGTPPYMSPEQFASGDVDARSDVYSLGIIAYELLAGRTPFQATELIAWASQHMSVAPPALPETAGGVAIPESFRVAIARALAKEPAQRPTTARAFYEELSSRTASLAETVAASIVAGAALPEQAPTQAPAPRRRRLRVAIIAAVVVAVGAVAVGVTDLVGRRRAALAPAATSGLVPTDVAPTVTIASSASTVTPPLGSIVLPTVESAPPLARPRVSTCAAIAMASDCATIAVLKPKCTSADPFHESAQARCSGLCAALCGAPQRRPR